MDCSEFIRLLDEYIDGELEPEKIAELDAHSAACGKCREERRAAEQLKAFLSHDDDGISVPLPAQAAWRKAVKAEARRRSMSRFYRAAGALAAVCVLTLSIALIRPAGTPVDAGSGSVTAARNGAAVTERMVYVETDGVSASSALNDAEESAAETELSRVVLTEDSATAYAYLSDILAEYGGTEERSSAENGKQTVHVRVPGENAADFLQAVEHIGVLTNADETQFDESDEWVRVRISFVKQGDE